jgi:hypothetical protein
MIQPKLFAGQPRLSADKHKMDSILSTDAFMVRNWMARSDTGVMGRGSCMDGSRMMHWGQIPINSSRRFFLFRSG